MRNAIPAADTRVVVNIVLENRRDGFKRLFGNMSDIVPIAYEMHSSSGCPVRIWADGVLAMRFGEDDDGTGEDVTTFQS